MSFKLAILYNISQILNSVASSAKIEHELISLLAG